jgi:hypothetical protein
MTDVGMCDRSILHECGAYLEGCWSGNGDEVIRLPVYQSDLDCDAAKLRGELADRCTALPMMYLKFWLAAQSISLHKTAQRSDYRAFANNVVEALRERSIGTVSEMSVPKLKQFPLPEPVRDESAMV